MKKFNKQATFKIHMESVHGKQVPNQTQINPDQHQEINNSRFHSQVNKSQSKLTFQDEPRNLRSYKKVSSALDPNN